MNIDTRALRAEPHGEIGARIERDADVLVERWCARAALEQPAAKRVHAEALRDHLPKFLRAMGRALCEPAGHAAEQRFETASRHGVERWRHGWSIGEVVRDYQLLRLVLLDHLEKTLERPLYYREVMAVGLFVDDAIEASIAAYAAHRDEEARAIERERAAALEAASRRKDEFMAVLGHELRNPLAPILNSVNILRALLRTAPPAVSTALEIVERQTKQLARLVDDMLDLARIGLGQFELRKKRVDLRTVLEQAVQTSEPVLSARGHRLTVSLPNVPVQLDADPDRLLQIVGNLLNNAAKYTDAGGQIWLTGESDGRDAIIRVRDNGIGIPPEMVARVFELFRQLEGSRDQSQGGLGIGLTLVQRLVQQHGGSVSCYSAGQGEGAEFVVSLPLTSAEASAEASVEAASPSLEAPALRVIPHAKQKRS